jgi:hypothetical protein
MAAQRIRRAMNLSGEMSRGGANAGQAARAMLATMRYALLEKNIAAHIEQADAERARQQAERQREAMSWERHAWYAGSLASRRARTQ